MDLKAPNPNTAIRVANYFAVNSANQPIDFRYIVDSEIDLTSFKPNEVYPGQISFALDTQKTYVLKDISKYNEPYRKKDPVSGAYTDINPNSGWDIFGGGVSFLDKLTDVKINNLNKGDVLVFDDVNKIWINKPYDACFTTIETSLVEIQTEGKTISDVIESFQEEGHYILKVELNDSENTIYFIHVSNPSNSMIKQDITELTYNRTKINSGVNLMNMYDFYVNFKDDTTWIKSKSLKTQMREENDNKYIKIVNIDVDSQTEESDTIASIQLDGKYINTEYFVVKIKRTDNILNSKIYTMNKLSDTQFMQIRYNSSGIFLSYRLGELTPPTVNIIWGKWREISEVHKMQDLEDVLYTNIADGDILRYDMSTSKWINKQLLVLDSYDKTETVEPTTNSTTILVKLKNQLGNQIIEMDLTHTHTSFELSFDDSKTNLFVGSADPQNVQYAIEKIVSNVKDIVSVPDPTNKESKILSVTETTPGTFDVVWIDVSDLIDTYTKDQIGDISKLADTIVNEINSLKDNSLVTDNIIAGKDIKVTSDGNNITIESEIDLSGYDTSLEVDTKISEETKDFIKPSNIIAGSGISLTVKEHDVTIDATNVGGGGTLSKDLTVDIKDGAFGIPDKTVFPKDTPIEDILTMMLRKAINPTYIKPTLVLNQPVDFEIGSNVDLNILSTFTQNDAGSMTSFELMKDSDIVSTTLGAYTETINVSENNNPEYRANITFEDGPIKQDSFGNDYTVGQIKGGIIQSNIIKFNPIRYGWIGVDNLDTVPTSSDDVRLLDKKISNLGEGSQVVDVQSGSRRICIAIPGDKTITVQQRNLGDITSSFKKSTVSVYGANEKYPTNYSVYTFIAAIPYPANAILDVVIL